MAISKINDCFELLAMNKEEEYYLKDIINHLNYKQPQVVKAVKNLSQENYFNKKRNEHDERTVLILVDSKQRKKIDDLLKRVNNRITEANNENEV